MKLSEALCSRFVTDGDLNKVRKILDEEPIVDIAGCMFTSKIAAKLTGAKNVTDSEDESIRTIIEENIALNSLLSEKQLVNLPSLFRPVDEWLQSLQTDVIYDCSQNYQHGILALIAKPAVMLTFSYATKYAFGLISQSLYSENDMNEIFAGSEYVLVPNANAFFKYRYEIKGIHMTVEHAGTYKMPLGIMEARIIPGYFGERQLLHNAYWQPVMRACLAAAELRNVKKATLYSFLVGNDG